MAFNSNCFFKLNWMTSQGYRQALHCESGSISEMVKTPLLLQITNRKCHIIYWIMPFESLEGHSAVTRLTNRIYRTFLQFRTFSTDTVYALSLRDSWASFFLITEKNFLIDLRLHNLFCYFIVIGDSLEKKQIPLNSIRLVLLAKLWLSLFHCEMHNLVMAL